MEDTIKRIGSHRGTCLLCALAAARGRTLTHARPQHQPPAAAGVEGIIVCNYEGVALKSTLTPAATAKYAGLLSQVRFGGAALDCVSPHYTRAPETPHLLLLRS